MNKRKKELIKIYARIRRLELVCDVLEEMIKNLERSKN